LLLLLLSPVRGAEFAVDSFDDGLDSDPGDGVCATVDGRCTLRAAVMEANALPGLDRITLAPGRHTLALEGHQEDESATGDLDLTDDLVLSGAGLGDTILDAGGLDRALDLHGATLELRDLTVEGGRLADEDFWPMRGAGIRADGGSSLTLSRVLLQDNGADGYGNGGP
jgi:CSLREA domain-containing protein